MTYRILAFLLSLSLWAGVTLPSGLHLTAMELCESMQNEATHPDHSAMADSMGAHEDCPMQKHAATHDKTTDDASAMHDFGINCSCSIEQAPVKTESQVLHKVKVPVPVGTGILVEEVTLSTESETKPVYGSDSYSPPPIFILNESFLI